MHSSRFAALMVSAIAALALPTRPADAALIESTPEAHLAHSQQYHGAPLWLRVQQSDGSQIVASAVRLNEWYGLTSAHVVRDGGIARTILQAGNGTNRVTDPGEVRDVVTSLVNPAYSGSAVPAAGSDLAIIRFSSPLAGPDVTIGDVELGDLITFVGHGRVATTSGVLTDVRDRMAWDGEVGAFGTPGIASEDYARTIFQAGEQMFGGNALTGDSGSPGFNEMGELVSLVTLSSHGTTSRETQHSLSLAPYADWIAANTVVPEPSSLAVLGVGAGLVLGRRRRRAS